MKDYLSNNYIGKSILLIPWLTILWLNFVLISNVQALLKKNKENQLQAEHKQDQAGYKEPIYDSKSWLIRGKLH